jgi:hypothetical protein
LPEGERYQSWHAGVSQHGEGKEKSNLQGKHFAAIGVELKKSPRAVADIVTGCL